MSDESRGNEEEIKSLDTFSTDVDIAIAEYSPYAVGIFGLMLVIGQMKFGGPWFLTILIFIGLTFGAYYFSEWWRNTKKYMVCPYCNKSVLVYCNWQCDHCDNFQNKDRWIFKPCIHCNRKLKTVICEKCHKEMKI